MNGTEAEYEQIPIDALTPHPDNPRRGDVEAIAESIKANGFFGAVIVQRSSGHIVAGNHRWKAAKLVGMLDIPVIWADVDDDEAKRILLIDNRTSDLATYDEQARLQVLEGLEDFTGTGYTADDANQLQALLTEIPEPRPNAEQAVETEDSARITGPLGLREVRLMLTTEQYERFQELVSRAREMFGASNTSQAVLAAMKQTNE